MPEKVTEAELLKLYRDRLKDRRQAKTRRRRKLESHPETVAALLKSVFSKDREALRKMEESRALMAWPAIVGPAASRASRAEKVKGTTLIVRVADPLWMQQLSLLKQDLLAKYRKQFPSL